MALTEGAILGLSWGIGALFIVAFTAYRIVRMKLNQRQFLIQGRHLGKAISYIPAGTPVSFSNGIVSPATLPSSSTPTQPTKSEEELYY